MIKHIDGIYFELEMLPPPSKNIGICHNGHLHTAYRSKTEGAYFNGSQHELVTRLKSKRKGEIIGYSV